MHEDANQRHSTGSRRQRLLRLLPREIGTASVSTMAAATTCGNFGRMQAR